MTNQGYTWGAAHLWQWLCPRVPFQKGLLGERVRHHQVCVSSRHEPFTPRTWVLWAWQHGNEVSGLCIVSKMLHTVTEIQSVLAPKIQLMVLALDL